MIKRVLAFIERYFRVKIIKIDKYEILFKDSLKYKFDNLYTFNNADFLLEENFQKAYIAGKKTDKSGLLLKNYEIFWRIHVLLWAAQNASKLEGDFIEFGVNTGIFAKSIITYLDFNKTNKTFFLLDTFTGLDKRYSAEYEINRLDYSSQKNLYDEVKENFKSDNVQIIQGSVPDTLSLITSSSFAFVSVDMNTAFPEIEAIKFIWNKLSMGGIIVLDDYGYPGHEDQKIKHDLLAIEIGYSILSLPTCQGLIIKY